MTEALHFLKKYFGYTAFREPQGEVISHILAGKDALVLMPTGGGKSLCYQLPALMLPGTTVVVSPLISLMKDQVDQLRANGICAATLNSSTSPEEQQYMRQKTLTGELKLLYVSPERLLLDLPGLLRDLCISLFAIDEAHCISQWGHDFRKEYTQMGILKQTCPGVPVIALTATADKVTRDDILRQMNIPEARVFLSDFDRPNLSLTVRQAGDSRKRQRQVLDFVLQHPGECGIVYCLSRKNTETVAAMLELHGIPVAVYHAGLSNEERERAQQDFVNDRVQVVCATVAFGMGINKSNVRFVVHYNLPKSIENYYQEIGRAGRDGLPSDTLLLYSLQDVVQLRRFAEESGQQEINGERLSRMIEYAQSGVCRRRTLLNYCGQTMAHDCMNCDICKHPPVRFDGTEVVQKALSAVVRTGQQATWHNVVDIVCGNYSAEIRLHGWDRLPTFAVGRNIPARYWRDFISQMLQLGYVEIAYDRQNHLQVTAQGADVLYGRSVARLYEPAAEEPRTKGRAKRERAVVVAKETKAAESPSLFEHLRKLRKQLADQQGFPPYIVMSDKVLHDLAALRPTTPEQMSTVSGIGDFKLKKYGADFLRAIREFSDQ